MSQDPNSIPNSGVTQERQKVALVTGASRGIGRALALELAQRRYHVVALARTIGALEELDDEIAQKGGSATLVPIDLADTEKLDNVGPGLFERWQHLDLFAGIAGTITELLPSWQIEPGIWHELMTVNATANVRLVRSLDPLLRRASKASVVFASGGAPEPARPYWASYAASKAALTAFAETYANEVSDSNIKVSLIDPGPTNTALRKRVYPSEDRTTLQTPETAAAKFLAIIEGHHDAT